MTGFTKLFNSILYSTIWTEPDHVRITWITMLAMADKYGDVKSSLPGLARMAGVSIEKVQEALECFKSPDPHSSTKDYEGRRILDIDGGWNLINHGKYRALMSAEERKEYNRMKQAERRERLKNGKKSTNVNDSQLRINDNQQSQHIQKQIAEADTEASTPVVPKGTVKADAVEEVISLWNSKALPHWTKCRAPQNWKDTIRTRLKDPFWRDNWKEALQELVQNSCYSEGEGSDWSPNIEFFLRSKTVAAILEGKYKKFTSNSKPSPFQPEFDPISERTR